MRWRGLALLALLLGCQGLRAEPQTVLAEPAMQQVTLSAFTRARRQLKLPAEASGRIVSVDFDVGDRLAPRQPFACVDTTFSDLELRANSAERQRLEVDLAHFDKQVTRLSRLLKQHSSSQSQLDEATHNRDLARARLRELAIARETLTEKARRHCVTGPAGWRVVERLVEPGQWVNTGEPLALLGDYSRLRLPFALTPAQLRVLRSGGWRLREADSGRLLPARLAQISPAFDAATRKTAVELELDGGLFDDPRGGLRLLLDLELPLSDAVLAPESAVTRRYEEYWLTRENGEALRAVYLGREADGRLRLRAPGLKPGDRLRLPAD